MPDGIGVTLLAQKQLAFKSELLFYSVLTYQGIEMGLVPTQT